MRDQWSWTETSTSKSINQYLSHGAVSVLVSFSPTAMFSSCVHYSEYRGKRKEPPAWPQRKRGLPSNIFVRNLRTLISYLCVQEIEYYEVVIQQNDLKKKIIRGYTPKGYGILFSEDTKKEVLKR